MARKVLGERELIAVFGLALVGACLVATGLDAQRTPETPRPTGAREWIVPAGGVDRSPAFRQVDVPILLAQKVVNERKLKPGEQGFWVAENADEFLRAFPDQRGSFDWPVPSGEMPGVKDVRWHLREVFIVFVLALKENRDPVVSACWWTQDGGRCAVNYKLGPKGKMAAMVIGKRRVEADFVTKSFGVVTTRPKPVIVATEEK